MIAKKSGSIIFNVVDSKNSKFEDKIESFKNVILNETSIGIKSVCLVAKGNNCGVVLGMIQAIQKELKIIK